MNSVAEGVWTTKAVRALGRMRSVDLPITEVAEKPTSNILVEEAS